MLPAAFSVASFGIALSFLTRLNLPPWVCRSERIVVDPASIATSVVWYPVVGLIVGLLSVVPAYGLYALTALWGHGGQAELSWLGAWLYVVAGFVLTRGLHWDGLADISDAWGSGAQGQRFWDIVKDSRLGAFGAMGQLLACSGLLIAAQGHISQQQWWPLVWACVVGRVATLLLAAHCAPRDAQSLGGMAGAGATKQRAYAWATFVALATALLWGLGSLTLLAVLLGSVLVLLARSARAQQGCNGDFLGVAIVGGELCCLLTLLL